MSVSYPLVYPQRAEGLPKRTVERIPKDRRPTQRPTRTAEELALRIGATPLEGLALLVELRRVGIVERSPDGYRLTSGLGEAIARLLEAARPADPVALEPEDERDLGELHPELGDAARTCACGCGERFEPRHPSQRFAAQRCRQRAYRRRSSAAADVEPCRAREAA